MYVSGASVIEEVLSSQFMGRQLSSKSSNARRTAERFWSPDYNQHSAHIAPGREGLFNLIKSIPPTLKYEPGVVVAGGDFVIIHDVIGSSRLCSQFATDSRRV